MLSLHNYRDARSLQGFPGSGSTLMVSTLHSGKAGSISTRSERDKTWITVV